MIRHLFRLVWNRKRTHLLIVAEIFLAFIVVFALLVTGLHFLNLYRMPMGFDHTDTVSIYVDREHHDHEWQPGEAATFRSLQAELRAMPQVRVVAAASNHPFSQSQMTTSWDDDAGLFHRAEVAFASPELDEALDIRVVAGRWFEEGDHAQAWNPVVIDRRLARELYGDDDPVGQTIVTGNDAPERRVIGVVEAFRLGGPFAEPVPFIFRPFFDLHDEGRAINRLIVRLDGPPDATFEQTAIDRLGDIAPGWTFTFFPLDVARASRVQERIVPLAVLGTVGGFLLIMVILGLTGVMWQNVVRRTREIGLRRATGAHRGLIHRQIVLEVMITALFGVLLGTAVAAQVPLVGPFTFVPVPVVVQGIVVSSLFLLVLAGTCGLYPGWSATRVHPAEALHHE